MVLKRRQTFHKRIQGILVCFNREEYPSIEISVLTSILARIIEHGGFWLLCLRYSPIRRVERCSGPQSTTHKEPEDHEEQKH